MAVERHHASSLKAGVVIEKVSIEEKDGWLDPKLSKLKLVGWRIALAAIFFFLKATIRSLD